MARLERKIAEFREVVNDYALRDLGYRGKKFTWLERVNTTINKQSSF